MGDGNGAGTFVASAFVVVALIFGWKSYNLVKHPSEPTISTPYATNAVAMDYVDQCGDTPVCVWTWQWDGSDMPGWVLHYSPQTTVPADARPVKSLPVLCDPNPCPPPKKSDPWWKVWRHL